MMSKRTFKPDEHIFIAGMTGGGKTKLVEAYLWRFFNRITKLDTKGESMDLVDKGQSPWVEVPQKELVIVEKLDDYFKAFEDGYPYMIYSPVEDELNDETFEEFFKFQYDSRDNTTFIDELMQVNETPHRIGRWLKGLYTRGRSRHTNVIACTQRPSGIHNLTISQSSHVFSFDLNLMNDRKKISELTGTPEFVKMPRKYNFWYWKQGDRNATRGRLTL